MIILYSITPCRPDPPHSEPLPCMKHASTWNEYTKTWAATMAIEALIEDPLFLLVAVLTRQALISCLCCEFVFKNRAFIICCKPVEVVMEYLEKLVLCCCM